jgi:hypothetical protein
LLEQSSLPKGKRALFQQAAPRFPFPRGRSSCFRCLLHRRGENLLVTFGENLLVCSVPEQRDSRCVVGERISLLWYRANQEILSKPNYATNSALSLSYSRRAASPEVGELGLLLFPLGRASLFALLQQAPLSSSRPLFFVPTRGLCSLEEKRLRGPYSVRRKPQRGSMALQRAPDHRGGELRSLLSPTEQREEKPLVGVSLRANKGARWLCKEPPLCKAIEGAL